MAPAFASITGRIAVIALRQDVGALDTYIGSDAFLQLFAAVPSNRRPSVFTAYQTARAKCLARRPVAAAGTRKADWTKPGEIERFKRLWLKHGGNKLLVANAMRITEGAVKVARSRFIVHGATATYVPVKKPPGKAQEGRDAPRSLSAARSENGAVRGLPVAA